MFVRVIRGSHDPNRRADVIAVVEGQVVPTLKAQPGFGGYYGGLDERAGRNVTVTLWDTAAQAAAVREALGEAVLRALADASVQLEPPEIYELVARA